MESAVSELFYNVNTFTFVCDNVKPYEAEARSPKWSALYSGND
jgi:hypothetical protein